MSGQYIYGFCGLAPQKNLEAALQEVNKAGLTFTLISCKDIAALLRDCAEAVLRPTIESCEQYQGAIHAFYQKELILPVQFGTVAPSREAVSAFLQRNYPSIRRALKENKERCEFQVTAFWHDLQATLNEVAAANWDITRLKEEVLKSSATVSERTRVEVGVLLAEALAVMAKRKSEKILLGLSPFSLRHHFERISSDTMLFNVTFLVQKSRATKFEDALYNLGSKMEGRINFQYQGPMPPSSFVDLKLEAA